MAAPEKNMNATETRTTTMPATIAMDDGTIPDVTTPITVATASAIANATKDADTVRMRDDGIVHKPSTMKSDDIEGDSTVYEHTTDTIVDDFCKHAERHVV